MTGQERDWHAEWEDERRCDEEDPGQAFEGLVEFSLTRRVADQGRRKVYVVQTVQWIQDDGTDIRSAYYGRSVLAFTTREKAAAWIHEQRRKDPTGPQLGIGEVYLDEQDHGETDPADRVPGGELLPDA